MKQKILYIAGMITAVALVVIGWCILPETVAVQIGADGNVSGTMPKAAAILIPAAMSLAGGMIGMRTSGQSRLKGTLLLCAGIGITVFMLIFNR